MAERGKPIPFSIRLQIRELIATQSMRRIAEALGLSKTTVQKYGTRALKELGRRS